MSILKPLLSSNWDFERKRLTYKVQPAGTSKFVLLNQDELKLLQKQIDAALEGTHVRASSG
jgi:hypothetical protein